MSVRPPAIALHENLEDDAADVEESPMRDGRNENSLAYLCQRFCEMYRNHSDPINIDLAAKELGIQRRRMYEILNIIQSVGLVSRLRASFYRWEGQDKMIAALEKLKDDGMARVANSRPGVKESINPASCLSPEGQRRKAVATALGERFVQIFLCNEVPQPVILEDIMGLFASCVGGVATSSNGSPAALTNQTSCARRLYDIANVFCSIGLVRKSCAAATDNRRKKRLYVWIGPVPPATTTPLRPQRTTIVAPNASPGSSSAKRVKREHLDTPPSSRKKSRLGSATLNLEASMIKVEEEEEKEEHSEERKHKVLQHPVVTSLRGGREGGGGGGGGLMPPTPPPSLAGAKRAMLVSRSLEPLRRAKPSSSLFNPPNAKDGPLKTSPLRSAAVVIPTKPTPPPPCECKPPANELKSSQSPTLLHAQIAQLRKELEDAKAREQELLKRIDMQDSQINKLIDAKVSTANANANAHRPQSQAQPSPSTTAFLLSAGHSPLTSLVFSPFQGSLARDAFSSLTASPSPFSGNNFFSTGLTGSGSRSGRPPFMRKPSRIGPFVVDPTTNDDDHLLSPATTSIASALLMSPTISISEKENSTTSDLQLVASPLRPLPSSTKSDSSSQAPSTPRCHLVATAASSLLSLTPSQVHSRFDGHDHDHDALLARTKASSPEPSAVRTPASVAAPSSPSPSAKGAKTIVRHRSHSHSVFDGRSPLPKTRISDCLS